MGHEFDISGSRDGISPGAFLAAAVWGGQRGGQMCIGGQEFRMT